MTLSIALCACEEDTIPPGANVDSFRVIAEQVDLPYARPGERVRIRALSVEPDDRPVTWAWASCVNPPSTGLAACAAQLALEADPSSFLLATGEGIDNLETTIPSDALDDVSESARAAANVGIISVACPGDLSIEVGAGPGGLPFRCREAGSGRDLGLDEFSAGVKRVMIRERDRNQNPVVQGVSFDGDDWPADEIKSVGFCDTIDFEYDACPNANRHSLGVRVDPESFESGIDEFGDAFTEQVIVQYYATEGIFEDEVKLATEADNGWVARKRASGQVVSLWFVIRDDRGGVAWTERSVEVR